MCHTSVLGSIRPGVLSTLSPMTLDKKDPHESTEFVYCGRIYCIVLAPGCCWGAGRVLYSIIDHYLSMLCSTSMQYCSKTQGGARWPHGPSFRFLRDPLSSCCISH